MSAAMAGVDQNAAASAKAAIHLCRWFGIGIPHASTDLIHEVTGAFGRSRSGVNFDALDNQPVNLVMLFLVPQGQFQKHLHTLANIAKILHNKDFREELENAPDGSAMFEAISRQAQAK